AIREATGIRDRRDWSGKRQGTAGQKTGCASLPRYKRRQCGGGIAKARRGSRDSGDRAERTGDFRARGWIISKRQVVGSGCTRRAADSERVVADYGKAVRGVLVLRHSAGFPRH